MLEEPSGRALLTGLCGQLQTCQTGGPGDWGRQSVRGRGCMRRGAAACDRAEGREGKKLQPRGEEPLAPLLAASRAYSPQ